LDYQLIQCMPQIRQGTGRHHNIMQVQSNYCWISSVQSNPLVHSTDIPSCFHDLRFFGILESIIESQLLMTEGMTGIQLIQHRLG